MEDKELLKLLNCIEYSDEELEELEGKAIKDRSSIGEDLYKVKNDKVLRNISFIELEQQVKSKLYGEEQIKYKMIALQSYLDKNITAVLSGAMGAQPTIYIGLFVTNYRIFIYKLGHTYNLIDEEYCNEIKNIQCLVDMWDEFETIGIRFDDKREFQPRPYGTDNVKVFLALIKYLSIEKTIKIEKQIKQKMSLLSKILIISFYVFILLLAITMSFNIL